MPDNNTDPRVQIPRPIRTPRPMANNPWNVTVGQTTVRTQEEIQNLINAERMWFNEAVINDTNKLKTKEVADDSNVVVSQYYGVSIHNTVKKAVASHPGQTIFGIELEIENFPVHISEAQCTGFIFKEDGSLRNNGIEAISIPNNKIGSLKVAEMLWAKYKISDANFSDRTSIHVHTNVSHFTCNQLRALILAYQTVEELLFDYIGNSRKENIFCVPWFEAGINLNNYKRILSKPREWHKYTALNLAPVATQGSVEFRHCHGHADITQLTNWITLIDELMQFAEKTPIDDIKKDILSLNTTSEYQRWIQSMFPTSFQIISGIADWQQKLSRGILESKIILS